MVVPANRYSEHPTPFRQSAESLGARWQARHWLAGGPKASPSVTMRLAAPSETARVSRAPRPALGQTATWQQVRATSALPPQSGHALTRLARQFRAITGSNNHSMTSSAVERSLSGTVRPSAFAVLRLTISSYLLGACTGSSLGFSPRSIRSTYDAARRSRSVKSGP